MACLVTVAASAGQVRAQNDRTVKLDYAIYVGGFETIRVSFHTSLTASTYKMKMAMDGQGILDWWFSMKMSAFSEGRLAQGTYLPVRAGADSTWNGEDRKIRLSYIKGEAPIAVIKPPAEDDDRDEVPPALRMNSRDLAAAVLAGLSQLTGKFDKSNGCDAREAVFDGRRRYDLVMAPLGKEKLEPSNYSAFSGPALRCTVKIDKIAGFKRKPKRSKWRTSDDATLWVGQVFAKFPPVPVRIDMDTLLGAVRVHLVRATLKDGSETRSLAAAN